MDGIGYKSYPWIGLSGTIQYNHGPTKSQPVGRLGYFSKAMAFGSFVDKLDFFHVDAVHKGELTSYP